MPSVRWRKTSSSVSRSGTSAFTRMPAATSAALSAARRRVAGERHPQHAGSVAPGGQDRDARLPLGDALRRRDVVDLDPDAVGRAAERARRTLRDDPPLRHHAHAVAHRLHLGQQVARDEHGRAVVGQPAQELPHLAHAGRVEAVRRLVEHQQLGLAQQRQPDPQALAHPLAVRLHALVGRVREPDLREALVDARRAGGGCRLPGRPLARSTPGSSVRTGSGRTPAPPPARRRAAADPDRW